MLCFSQNHHVKTHKHNAHHTSLHSSHAQNCFMLHDTDLIVRFENADQATQCMLVRCESERRAETSTRSMCKPIVILVRARSIVSRVPILPIHLKDRSGCTIQPENEILYGGCHVQPESDSPKLEDRCGPTSHSLSERQAKHLESHKNYIASQP